MKKWVFSYSKAKAYEKFSSIEDSSNKVFNYLYKNFNFKNKDVLEVGCGTGRYTKFIVPLVQRYFALEPSKNMLNIAKNKCKSYSNIKYYNCSAESIPLKNESVDIVFASWALSSMNSTKIQIKAFNEMIRVLKNEGTIILVENQYKSEFVDLLKLYSSFKKSPSAFFIKKFGFKIIKKISTSFNFKNPIQAKKILAQAFPWLKTDEFFKKKKTEKIKHDLLILTLNK